MSAGSARGTPSSALARIGCAAFLGLDVLPEDTLLGGARPALGRPPLTGKHMRMTPLQLVADGSRRRLEIEGAALARDLCMKHHLKQQVPELVLEMREILALDGVGDLIGFLDGVGGDARECLLAVPRAAVGRAQPLHDREQLLDARAHGAAGGGPAISMRRNVCSIPAVAPQTMRSPYGMSQTSIVMSSSCIMRDL